MQNLRVGQPVVFTFDSEHQPLLNAIRTLDEAKCLPEPSKPAHEVIFQHFQAGYNFELMWVIKSQLKLWKRTDYPFNLPACRAYESGGQAMIARLNLCDAVLDSFPPDILAYNTAIPFWTRVELEAKTDSMRAAYLGLGKRELEDELRNTIDKLKNWENPYKPDDQFRFHSCNLIYAAIAIGKRQDCDSKQIKRERKDFVNKFWKPYIDALEKILKDSQEGVSGCKFKSFHIKGDNVVVQLSGRQIKLIYSPPKTNISNRGRNPKPKI